LLCYFSLAHHVTDDIVSFERYQITEEIAPNWPECKIPINTRAVNIHIKRMEDEPADAFVNFANKRLHIHQIIPSATQEEVLFSCCPEAFPGILFCETLLDNEIMLIKGCRRFLDYTGYLNTFEFSERFDPPKPPQDMIVIDAVYSRHFLYANAVRDLNKAYFSFTFYQGKKIATGPWGCGAFGGDKVHKFVQQLCAATLASKNKKDNDNENSNNNNNNHKKTKTVELVYSTFKEVETAEKYGKILYEIGDSGATVADLFAIMTTYQPSRKVPFELFLSQALTKLEKWVKRT